MGIKAMNVKSFVSPKILFLECTERHGKKLFIFKKIIWDYF